MTGITSSETARRWAAEDAAEAKERDGRAMAESLRESQNAARKLERDERARQRQYTAWDKQLQSEAFADYLIERGLKLRDWTKGLPRAPEMERAALGAMMMLQDAPITKAMRRLHPRHFGFDPFGAPVLNAKVFIAITRLEKARQTNRHTPLRSIDLLSVHEELRRMGAGETGVLAYLRACVDECPSAANIDYYISHVIEKSRLRHLFALGEALQGATSAPDADAARLQNIASNALAAINAHGWCDLKAIFEKEK